MEKYLELGKIINKRGIKGELKIESYTDCEEDFLDIPVVSLDKNGKDERKIESCKFYKGFVYLKISGVDSPEGADLLRGRTLYVDRDYISVDESEVFLSDVIGLSVFDKDSGVCYGKIKDIIYGSVYNTFVIANGDNQYLLPDVDEFIDSIDIEEGMTVTPIPGLFGDAEEVK